MDLEEQVTSLLISRKLKEIGVPQNSLFHWGRTISTYGLPIGDEYALQPALSFLGMTHDYAAFTVAELGELLPRCYMSWASPQNGDVKWWCRRQEQHFVTHEETPIFTAGTEADARAKMVIYLMEEQPSDIQ